MIRTTGNALWASPLTFLEASTPGTGGFFDPHNQRIGVQHRPPIETAEDLAKVAIEDRRKARRPPAGSPLRLGDVADVVEDHQPLIGDAVFADGDGLIVVVEKFPEANTIEVTEGVEDAIEACARACPASTSTPSSSGRRPTSSDAADNLRRSRSSVGRSCSWRLGRVLLQLAPSRSSSAWWRSRMSLLAAALVLYWRGATLNAMVLAGLLMALAAVIDDAVVDVDRSARRLRRAPTSVRAKPSRPDRSQVVLGAVLESGRTIGFTLVAMVFALLPTFVLGGLAGESFYPALAVAFLVAVAVSMLVALTVTPALALILLPAEAVAHTCSPLVARRCGVLPRVARRGTVRASPSSRSARVAADRPRCRRASCARPRRWCRSSRRPDLLIKLRARRARRCPR